MAVYKKYVRINDPAKLVLVDLPFCAGHLVMVEITTRTDGPSAYRRLIQLKDPSRLVLRDLPFKPRSIIEATVTDLTDSESEAYAALDLLSS